MAHVLRLKLQALHCSRLLSSPALASKLPDSRHIPWRCYGESALLNANDIDGDSKDSASKRDGAEDRVSTEPDLAKLTTRSIYDRLRAKVNLSRDEKDNGFQMQVDPLSTKESKKPVTEDKWSQVMSSVRTMTLKNKSKAGAGDKLGLPKAEAKEDQDDFSDLDLPEAGSESGVSRDPNGLNKSSLATNAFGRSIKQKMSQSLFLHQQKSKDTKPFSFLKSLDDNTSSTQTEKSENKTTLSFTETDFFTEDLISGLKPSKFLDKNQPRNKDAMTDGADSKMSKGKNSALPRAAQGGSNPPVWNQSRSKDTTQGMSDFRAKVSGDAPSAQLHGKIPSHGSEATNQPSHNDNSVPHTGYMVCVQNIPAIINPAMIKSSMAIHGEVLGIFKKTRNDYSYAYIQFKNEQGMENAVAARKLHIGGKVLYIMRTDRVFSTVVRLSKVNFDTTEKQLLSICGNYGSIDNIRKRSHGVYDVFYQVKELPNMTSILGSLNEVTLHRATWSALPAPTLHPSAQKEALKSSEGQAWHEAQVNQALNRIESGIDGVSVLFEDLKELTALGKELSKR